MTDIKDRTVPYEILIRFDEQGALSGAHFMERRIVEFDGERLRDVVSDPQAIATAAGGPHGEALAAVLGVSLTQALARVEALENEAAAMRAAIEAAETKLAELSAARDDAERRLQASMGEIPIIGGSVRADVIRVE